jgi:hypothetical protein
MSKLKARLKRLEDALVGSTSCLGCAPRQISCHQEYELPDGETVTLPPFPKLPKCTCRNPEMKISFVVFRHPGQVSSREEAERQYAEYAKFHVPWQPENYESD